MKYFTKIAKKKDPWYKSPLADLAGGLGVMGLAGALAYKFGPKGVVQLKEELAELKKFFKVSANPSNKERIVKEIIKLEEKLQPGYKKKFEAFAKSEGLSTMEAANKII